MTRLTAARDFLLESLHLLYWAFFKPFTLREHLRSIDPDLDVATNPFKFRDRFPTNPRLRRYAGQAKIFLVFAQFPVLLVASWLYFIFIDSFDWFNAFLFLAGWWLIVAFASRFIFRQIRIIVLILLAILINFFIMVFSRGIWQEAIVLWLGNELLTTFRIWGKFILPLGIGMVIGLAGDESPLFIVSTILTILATTVIVAIGAGVIAISLIISETFDVNFVIVTVTIIGLLLGAMVGPLNRVKKLKYGLLLTVGISAFSLKFGLAFVVAYMFILVRLYFWLPEALWMAALGLITSDGQHARRLRLLPPYFDQVIYLPLPFLEEFIARAYREHPQAALETLAYLNAYTNLQKPAARCMAQIALESLGRTRTLEEIASLADELAWLPSPAPKELSAFLPRLLEVSQSVRAALNTRRGLPRAEVLRRAVRQLEDIRKELILSSRRQDRGYGAVAAAWQPVLERAAQEEEARGKEEGQIPQPYVAGPALDPEKAANLLRGRADLFRELETLLLAPVQPVLLLYGGRRTGKTSFLNFLPRALGGDFLPLLVDLQGMASVSSLEGMARHLAKSIQESAQRARNLSLPAWDDDALRRDPFDAILTWFDAVEKRAPQRTLLLCLDEFERLDEVVQAAGSRAILNFLRHVMQHRRRWTLLFSGSHRLDELPAYWSDYLINTRALHISYLSPEDTRDLILYPAPDFPPIYAPEAVDEIVRLTRGQPYLTQLMGFELVEWLNRVRAKRVNLDDVRNILPVIFERGYEYFDEFWRLTLDDAGRNLLRFIVTHPEEPVPEEQQKIAQRLVRKEILQPAPGAPGRYDFQVPLVRLYVGEVVRQEA